jgi:hypothetical protein
VQRHRWLLALIILGSIDDDAHRELVTAAVGSRRRLHIIRLTTGLLIVAGAATAISLVGLVLFAHASGLAMIASLGLAWSGVLIGTAFGAPLHRPLIRHGATALAIALALLFGFFVLPPMQDILRRGSVDDTSRIAPCSSSRPFSHLPARLCRPSPRSTAARKPPPRPLDAWSGFHNHVALAETVWQRQRTTALVMNELEEIGIARGKLRSAAKCVSGRATVSKAHRSRFAVIVAPA